MTKEVRQGGGSVTGEGRRKEEWGEGEGTTEEETK